jgi:aryl-alcohol dehydrogenase-like predicted oxidoreductase
MITGLARHSMNPSRDAPGDWSRRVVLQSFAGMLIAGSRAFSAEPAEATSMATRTIPRTGERLPVVGVGTWQTFDVGANAPERAELRNVLRLLAEHGGRVIDSSPMYGEAERVVGDLTAELRSRDKFFFATKVWTRGRDAGIRQMEQSFRLMRTERMDLMQVHNLLDLETHLSTMREWQSAGRIRYLGVTHYHSGAYRDLEHLVRTKQFDFAQFNLSMAERDAEERLLPACAASGTAVIVNRPFAGASLFGRVKGRPLPAWAAELGSTSWAQFFLKWILGHPEVTCVIPGTRRVEHMKDNVQAGSGRLPDAALRKRMLDYIWSP